HGVVASVSTPDLFAVRRNCDSFDTCTGWNIRDNFCGADVHDGDRLGQAIREIGQRPSGLRTAMCVPSWSVSMAWTISSFTASSTKIFLFCSLVTNARLESAVKTSP